MDSAFTRTDRPSRRIRADQQIPGRNDLPNAGELADIITSEENARKTAHEDTSQLTQRLAALCSDFLLQLRKLGDEARTDLGRLGYGEDYVTLPERNWVASAVGDHLANRHRGLMWKPWTGSDQLLQDGTGTGPLPASAPGGAM